MSVGHVDSPLNGFSST